MMIWKVWFVYDKHLVLCFSTKLGSFVFTNLYGAPECANKSLWLNIMCFVWCLYCITLSGFDSRVKVKPLKGSLIVIGLVYHLNASASITALLIWTTQKVLLSLARVLFTKHWHGILSDLENLQLGFYVSFSLFWLLPCAHSHYSVNHL